MDTHDSVLEDYLTNVQKGIVDGGLIVKAMRDGKWDSAVPVKPTVDEIGFGMQNADGELMLTAAGQEQRETDDIKLEEIKCDFEAKKIECAKELRFCNEMSRQFEDNKEKAHSHSVDNFCSTLMKNGIKEKT